VSGHPFQNSKKRFLFLSSIRNMHDQGPPEETLTAAQKKKNHIKKPLNAFMLFMKEQRSKVVAECTLKESAAINQILGRKVRIKIKINLD
jgi:hypothetical protein